jgi:opacity protein-like surface antigen
MINKKALVGSAIIALLISSTSFAQTTKFLGPSLAITGSIVSAETKINNYTNSNSYSTELNFEMNTDDKNNQTLSIKIPGIDLNYSFAMGNNFLLAVGATYDFGKVKSENIYNEELNIPRGDAVSVLIRSSLEDHYSVYVQPTYVINKDSAIFAKAGRHYAKSNSNVTYCQSSLDLKVISNCWGGYVLEERLNSKQNVSGWGYGLGFKTFITDRLFVQAEGSFVNYGAHYSDDSDLISTIENTAKTKTNSATISVGYKF